MPETAYDEVYENGVLKSRVARVVSNAEVARRDAPLRLRQAYGTLRQWQQDAQAVADQSSNVSQAQIKELFRRFGVLCDRLADLLIAQALD